MPAVMLVGGRLGRQRCQHRLFSSLLLAPSRASLAPTSGAVVRVQQEAGLQMVQPAYSDGRRQRASNPNLKRDSTESSSVAWELIEGNKRFVAQRQKGIHKAITFPQLVDHFIEDQLNPTRVKAIIFLDAWSLTSAPQLVGMHPSETRSVRICGVVCGKSDSAVGAIEFLVEKVLPPVILVLGSSGNTVVQCAVRAALIEAGRASELPPSSGGILDARLLETKLVRSLLPVAQDALQERPRASFQKLCEITSHMNIWHVVENLLGSSSVIAQRVNDGNLQIHGAFLNNSSGHLDFLGEIPKQDEVLERVSQNSHQSGIRTADDAPLPADEAIVQLYAGNRRYAVGKGGQAAASGLQSLHRLSEVGQNPIAVVLGCADSRAPIEILFDMRAGDLFVLRNAGNACSTTACTLVGSAEYAITALRSKLIVVTGHTQCGAVTAAVQLSRRKEGADASTSIGQVLDNIMQSAVTAVQQLPDASETEQIKLATKLNVYHTMEKLMTSSATVKQGVLAGHLQVHGAIYDLFTGEVKWLDQHPELEKVVGKQLPLHQWKTSPYTYVGAGGHNSTGKTKAVVTKLSEGNRRFVNGTALTNQTPTTEPMAIIYCSSETKIPLESLFNVQPGGVVVQRSLGGLECDDNDLLLASLEYAVTYYKPSLLVVLADSDSQLVDLALEQIAGTEAPTATMMSVLSDIMVSALRAHNQVQSEQSMTAAARQRRMKQLTVELNALYAIESMTYSSVIRDAAMYRGLEIRVALLDELSGEVNFIGEHPHFYNLLRRST